MSFSYGLHEAKGRPQLHSQSGGLVADNGQSAAPIGSVGCECPNGRAGDVQNRDEAKALVE